MSWVLSYPNCYAIEYWSSQVMKERVTLDFNSRALVTVGGLLISPFGIPFAFAAKAVDWSTDNDISVSN